MKKITKSIKIRGIDGTLVIEGKSFQWKLNCDCGFFAGGNFKDIIAARVFAEDHYDELHPGGKCQLPPA